MAGPFHNCIKGTSSGAAGTGAFTPLAAASGFLAWSAVPTGWWGMVRFEDGSDWELSYCYWNGTTLSRGANQFVAGSGSLLTLTSAATAALVANGAEVGTHPGRPERKWTAVSGSGTVGAYGIAAPTTTGTGAAAAPATTNMLTEQVRQQITSATTANAQAALSTTAIPLVTSSTAGRGGWEFRCRFGATQIVTGQRLWIGAAGVGFVGNTGEPSAHTANHAVLAKDSTDTNMQLLTNSNAGTGTKIDTGIPLVANGLYEVTLWSNPGSLTVYMLLVRIDTGDIFYTSTSTDVPVSGATMMPQVIGGLSSTTGTAFVLQFCCMAVRHGH